MYAIRSRRRGFFVSVIKALGLIHFTDDKTRIPYRLYDDPNDLLETFEFLSEHVDDLVICEIVHEKLGDENGQRALPDASDT